MIFYVPEHVLVICASMGQEGEASPGPVPNRCIVCPLQAVHLHFCISASGRNTTPSIALLLAPRPEERGFQGQLCNAAAARKAQGEMGRVGRGFREGVGEKRRSGY